MKQNTILIILLGMMLSLTATPIWDNDIPIRQGVNIEWFRTGIDTNDGCAIFVWSDTQLGERDLYAQKVDANGNMVWGSPLLVDGKPDRQEDPVITKTSDGNFIIAWIEFLYDQDGDVYAQKINHNGDLLWQEGGMPVCTLVGGQISLNIEPDATGGAYIVWEDSRNPGKDIFGQRIDGNGNRMWGDNGIPIADGIGNESQNTMWADGTGGLLIGYHYSFSGEEDLYVKRFLADGTMAWDNTLELAVTPGLQSKIRMSPLGNGEFVFAWQDERSGTPDIYAQKVNLAGDMLWPNPYIVASYANSQQQNPRMVGLSDNSVAIFWEDTRLDPQNHDLFGQKINAAGEKLWGEDGLAVAVADFKQSQPRMASDGNGGVYVVWDDDRNGNAPNTDVYAQHISAAGVALWEANGKAICTAPNEQSGSLVKVSQDNIFINWMDMRNGSVGIYYQVLTPSGEVVLAENGQLVFWGLSGDAIMDQFVLLPRQNDAIAIWQDTRHANIGYQVYYQIINQDGTVLLEDNGRGVTDHSNSYQSMPHAAVSSDGYVCIVWEDTRNPNPKIYAQLIGPAGERLWGDMGMELTDAMPLAQYNPRVSYYEGSFYIGWSNGHSIGSDHYYHTYGQKITNGIKQWGPDGVLVSYLEPNNMDNECLFAGISDKYYIWTRTDQDNPSLVSVWVKHVDENGIAVEGWPESGIKASTYDSYDVIQVAPRVAATPEGVLVIWADLRGDFLKSLYGQHISANGEYLWDSLGLALSDQGREQETPSIVVGEDSFTIAWAEMMPPDNQDIAIQRFSYDGSPMWNELGLFVVQKPEDQLAPNLKSFHEGGMVAVWSDYAGFEPDIFYRYINDDGTFVGPSDGLPLCQALKSQYRPIVAPVDNSAFVAWADGRSSGKTEILGIYAQRIANDCVSNDDPAYTPLPVLSLAQNYPNPFNPQTTIRFSVNEASAPVELNIYNLKGQKVKSLYSGVTPRGEHSVVWNGTDDSNKRVSSGMYLYKITSGNQSQSRKMLLVK